ncbi:MAG: metallo-mystery pair system four-Cys motif protein [Myxococcales bacterium]|nr:metallo-mystery pair system four-Cys motif protein [Myxococcales bacterium]
MVTRRKSSLPRSGRARAAAASTCLLAGGLLLAACGDEAEDATPLAITFTPRVGAQPFACGTSYPGLGSAASSVSFADFRLFVSDVEAVDTAGALHPLALVPDGKWQNEHTALLDFENAVGACGELGTTETNGTLNVTGNVKNMTKLRFTLGVPEAQNHQNVGLAPAPLSLGAMFWSWQGGYKFLRLDFASEAPGAAAPTPFLVHLGSTGCQSASQTEAPATACGRPNRVTVELTGFDPARPQVVVDVATLLAGSNLGVNTPNTAPGCMSAPDDPECLALMPNLGLDVATGQCVSGCAAQKLFRIE